MNAHAGRSRWLSRLLSLQGVFYVVTGLWPFVDLQSFVAVAGPKPDVFQLHVTAALIVVIGIVLLRGARRIEAGIVWLAVLSAMAFAGLDIAYAPRLPETYWLDAIAEVLLAALIIVAARQQRG